MWDLAGWIGLYLRAWWWWVMVDVVGGSWCGGS